MKHILFITVLLFTASCQSNHKQYTNKGVVVGIDTTGTCGGKYILRIHEDSNTSYRFSVFPKSMDPDTERFPFPVYFNYIEAKRCGSIHFVIIKDMERIYRNAYGTVR